MCSDGFRISMSGEAFWISPAVRSSGPFNGTTTRLVFLLTIFIRTCFRLSTASGTSSTTPGIVENSWATPSTRKAVMAYPGSDERSTRRMELPMVTPNPLSRGWTMKRPNVGECDASSR
jgi:hypothetical protein